MKAICILLLLPLFLAAPTNEQLQSEIDDYFQQNPEWVAIKDQIEVKKCMESWLTRKMRYEREVQRVSGEMEQMNEEEKAQARAYLAKIKNNNDRFCTIRTNTVRGLFQKHKRMELQAIAKNEQQANEQRQREQEKEKERQIKRINQLKATLTAARQPESTLPRPPTAQSEQQIRERQKREQEAQQQRQKRRGLLNQLQRIKQSSNAAWNQRRGHQEEREKQRRLAQEAAQEEKLAMQTRRKELDSVNAENKRRFIEEHTEELKRIRAELQELKQSKEGENKEESRLKMSLQVLTQNHQILEEEINTHKDEVNELETQRMRYHSLKTLLTKKHSSKATGISLSKQQQAQLRRIVFEETVKAETEKHRARKDALKSLERETKMQQVLLGRLSRKIDDLEKLNQRIKQKFRGHDTWRKQSQSYIEFWEHTFRDVEQKKKNLRKWIKSNELQNCQQRLNFERGVSKIISEHKSLKEQSVVFKKRVRDGFLKLLMEQYEQSYKTREVEVRDKLEASEMRRLKLIERIFMQNFKRNSRWVPMKSLCLELYQITAQLFDLDQYQRRSRLALLGLHILYYGFCFLRYNLPQIFRPPQGQLLQHFNQQVELCYAKLLQIQRMKAQQQKGKQLQRLISEYNNQCKHFIFPTVLSLDLEAQHQASLMNCIAAVSNIDKQSKNKVIEACDNIQKVLLQSYKLSNLDLEVILDAEQAYILHCRSQNFFKSLEELRRSVWIREIPEGLQRWIESKQRLQSPAPTTPRECLKFKMRLQMVRCYDQSTLKDKMTIIHERLLREFINYCALLLPTRKQLQ